MNDISPKVIAPQIVTAIVAVLAVLSAAGVLPEISESAVEGAVAAVVVLLGVVQSIVGYLTTDPARV